LAAIDFIVSKILFENPSCFGFSTAQLTQHNKKMGRVKGTLAANEHRWSLRVRSCIENAEAEL